MAACDQVLGIEQGRQHLSNVYAAQTLKMADVANTPRCVCNPQLEQDHDNRCFFACARARAYTHAGSWEQQ